MQRCVDSVESLTFEGMVPAAIEVFTTPRAALTGVGSIVGRTFKAAIRYLLTIRPKEGILYLISQRGMQSIQNWPTKSRRPSNSVREIDLVLSRLAPLEPPPPRKILVPEDSSV